MDKLIAIWNWFNGKKSVIGGYALGAVMALQYLGTNYGFQFQQEPMVVKVLTDAGALLTGVGLAHKGAKLFASSPKGA